MYHNMMTHRHMVLLLYIYIPISIRCCDVFMRHAQYGKTFVDLLRHGLVPDMPLIDNSIKIQQSPLLCISRLWVHHNSDVSTVYTKKHRFNQEDVTTFCSLTGDINAIHTSQRAAHLAGFPGPIVPGILLASLFPSVISSYFPGALYLGQTLKFRHHALVGEELEARIEMISKKGDDHGMVESHDEPQEGKKMVDRKFTTVLMDARSSKVLVEGVAIARVSTTE